MKELKEVGTLKAMLLIGVAMAAFYWRLWPMGFFLKDPIYLTGQHIGLVFFPGTEMIRNAFWRYGEFPLWNPFFYSGVCHYQNPGWGMFHIPYLLYSLLPIPAKYTYHSAIIYHLVYVWFLGCASYLFFKEFSGSWKIALAGSFAMIFNSWIFIWQGSYIYISPLAWGIFALYFMMRFFREQLLWQYMMVILSLAMMLSCSHPKMPYVMILLFCLFFFGEGRHVFDLRKLCVMLLAAIVGAGLLNLFPFVKYLDFAREAPFEHGKSVAFCLFHDYWFDSSLFRLLLNAVLPVFFSQAVYYDIPAIGFLPLTVALVCIPACVKSYRVRYALVWTIFSFAAFVLIQFSPSIVGFWVIPFFKFHRLWSQILVVLLFGLICIVVAGWAHFRSLDYGEQIKIIKAAISVIVGFLVFGLIVVITGPHLGWSGKFGTPRFGGIVSAVLYLVAGIIQVGLLWWYVVKGKHKGYSVRIVLLAAGVFWLLGQQIIWHEYPNCFPFNSLDSLFRRAMMVATGEPGWEKDKIIASFLKGRYKKFPQNESVCRFLSRAENWTLPAGERLGVLGNVIGFNGRFFDLAQRVIPLQYDVGTTSLPTHFFPCRARSELEKCFLLFPGYTRSAYLIPKYKVITDAGTRLKYMCSDWKFDSEVILEKEPSEFRKNLCAKNRISSYSGEAKLVRRTFNSLEYDVTNKVRCDQFLFISDTYHPDWRAYIDGKRCNIYVANHVFKALVIPPGRHSVELHFQPPRLYLWIGVTCCMWLVWLGIIIVFRGKKLSLK